MYDLRELYQEMVVDHSRKPRNFGELAEANHSAEGFNPLCGDQITVYLKVEDDAVTDVSFVATGCAISKASASMMTEEIKGKSLGEVQSLFEGFRGMVTRQPGDDFDSSDLGDLEILSGVSQYPSRIKCATLSWHAMQAALSKSVDGVSTE
jgi:nitrogen fixation NifU-like protein